MNENLSKVLKMFGLMWLVTGLGLIIGEFIPSFLVLPIGIASLVLLIAMFFIRYKKKVSKALAYVFALFIGITLNSVISFYVGELGKEIVITVFGTVVILFATLGVFGHKLKKDLKSWGSILLILLLGLVVFSIVSIFVGMSNFVMLIASGFGVLLFVAYTIYDFNQLAKRTITEEDIPFLAINLYLDFINLFLELLKFVYYLKKMFD